MGTPLVILVRDAAVAGVDIARDLDGALKLRAPLEAASDARALRARQDDVCGLYDWSRAPVSPDREHDRPCVLCGRPSMLRDPVEHQPCHKTCVDPLLGSTAGGDTARAA